MPDGTDDSRNRHDRPRGRSWPTLACLAIYAIFLAVTPFEHHDLSCELKTPQHCVACTTTIVSANPDMPVAALACALADAGETTTLDIRAESLLLGVRTTGRSPPSDS